MQGDGDGGGDADGDGDGDGYASEGQEIVVGTQVLPQKQEPQIQERVIFWVELFFLQQKQ